MSRQGYDGPVPGVPAGTEPPRRNVGAELGTQNQLANSVIAYLITGPSLGGLAGWGIDSLAGTGFFLPLGLLLGMGLSLYVVWLRYGMS